MATHTLNKAKQIISWLEQIEKSANQLYTRAAKFFIEDKELFSFLIRLADDEESHAKFICLFKRICGLQPAGAVPRDYDIRPIQAF